MWRGASARSGRRRYGHLSCCGTQNSTGRDGKAAEGAPVGPTVEMSGGVASLLLLFVVGVLGMVVLSVRALDQPPMEEGPESVSVADVVSDAGSTMRYAHNPFCLIDADGDAHPDPVVKGYPTGGSSQVLWLFSGVDGELLWRHPIGDDDTLHCVSEDWFSVQLPTFETQFFAAKAPRTGPSVRLSDEIQGSGGQGGCVAFQTRDRRTTTLELPSGAVSDCAAPTPVSRYENPAHWSHMDDSIHSRGTTSRCCSCAKRAHRWFGSRRWREPAGRPSCPTRPTPSTPPRSSDGVLVLLVVRLGDDEDRVFAVGIDVQTGDLLYETPMATGITGFHGWAGPAADRVMVIANGKLSSLDARTGEVLWSR